MSWCAPLLLLFATSATSAAPDDTVFDEAVVAEEAARVVEVFRSESGVDLGDVRCRAVEPQAIIDALFLETYPRILRLTGQETIARKATMAWASAAGARRLIAYRTGDGEADEEILVSPRKLAQAAAALDMPQLNERAALRAALLHGYALAESRRAFGWNTTRASLADERAEGAFEAVVEGHAIGVARRLAPVADCSSGFDAYLASFARIVPDPLPVRNAQNRANAWRTEFPYVHGEAFVAAIAAANGEEAIAALFASPPRAPEEILRPEWFLDPASRPRALYDLTCVEDVVATRLAPSAWPTALRTLTPDQRFVLFQHLPMADVERDAVGTLHGIAVDLHQKGSANALVTIEMIEHATEQDAKACVDLCERLRMVQEKLGNAGAIETRDIVSTAVAEDGMAGTLTTRTRYVAGTKMPGATLNLWRGRLSLRMEVIAADLDGATMRELAGVLFEGVERTRAE
jgi:hypothetical protein